MENPTATPNAQAPLGSVHTGSTMTGEPTHTVEVDDYRPAADWTVRSLGLNEDAQLKQLRKHTTRFGRIVTLLFASGALVLGGIYWSRHKGYEARMQAVEQAGRLSTDAQMLQALRAAYKATPYDDVKERVLLNLGHFRDRESIDVMIDGLGRSGIVRRAAALALARVGYPLASVARPRLLEVLAKTDERDRPQVVWALAVLREKSAADAVLDQFKKGLLQSQPGFDPKVIAEVLGVDRLASADVVSHPDVSVRSLAAQALSEASAEQGGAQIRSALEKLMDAELKKPSSQQNAELIRSSALGLAKHRGAEVSPLLLRVLSGKNGLSASILEALGHHTAAPAVAELMQHTHDASLRVQLLKIIGLSHDARVAESLVSFINDPDQAVSSAAIMALGELGDRRAAPGLIKIASGSDDKAAKDALSVLSRIPSHGEDSALLALLKKQPGRRANILLALAGSTAGRAAIIKALNGDDAHAASLALARAQDLSSLGVLKKMLPRPASKNMSTPRVENEDLYRSRLIAIQSASSFQRQELAPLFDTIVNDALDDGRLRRAAAKGLGRVASDAEVRAYLEKIQSDETEPAVRRLYGTALWQVPRPELADEFFKALKVVRDVEISQALGLALGFSLTEGSRFEAELVAMLGDPDLRRAAAVALVVGGSAKTAPALLRVLSQDKELDEALRHSATAEDSEWLGLVTPAHISSGQLARRLASVDALRGSDSTPAASGGSYLWNHLMTQLRADAREPGQVDRITLRNIWVSALNGPGSEARMLAAKSLASAGEYGLLNAAIESKGVGADEARTAIRAR